MLNLHDNRSRPGEGQHYQESRIVHDFALLRHQLTQDLPPRSPHPFAAYPGRPWAAQPRGLRRHRRRPYRALRQWGRGETGRWGNTPIQRRFSCPPSGSRWPPSCRRAAAQARQVQACAARRRRSCGRAPRHRTSALCSGSAVADGEMGPPRHRVSRLLGLPCWRPPSTRAGRAASRPLFPRAPRISANDFDRAAVSPSWPFDLRWSPPMLTGQRDDNPRPNPGRPPALPSRLQTPPVSS